MATKWHRFKGKARYARPYEPDNAFGKNMWKTGIYLDEENLALLKQSGCQKTVKEDEGGKFVEFTREDSKLMLNQDTGKRRLLMFTPPIVYDKDGAVICDYINTETQQQVRQFEEEEAEKIQRRGNPVLIGNGSDVEVTVTIYDTQKGKGQTLQEIKVLDLIEYTAQPKQEGLPPLANPDSGSVALSELTPKKEAPLKGKSNANNPPW